MSVTKEEIGKYLKTQSPWQDHPDAWYQEGIELPYGFVTKTIAGDGDCRMIWERLGVSADSIRGKTVLDIGCNTGYYSMRCKEMGASKVTGIDKSGWMNNGKQFAKWKNIEIDWVFKDFYDFDWSQRFDTVFVLSVIYHLNAGKPEKDRKAPLRIVAQAAKETLYFNTQIKTERYDPELWTKTYQPNAYFPTWREFVNDLLDCGFLIEHVDCSRMDEVKAVIGSLAENRISKMGIKARRIK